MEFEKVEKRFQIIGNDENNHTEQLSPVRGIETDDPRRSGLAMSKKTNMIADDMTISNGPTISVLPRSRAGETYAAKDDHAAHHHRHGGTHHPSSQKGNARVRSPSRARGQ